jgi:hypothetical protein
MPGDHDGDGDGVTERPLVADGDTERDGESDGDGEIDVDGVTVREGDVDGQRTGAIATTRTWRLSASKAKTSPLLPPKARARLPLANCALVPMPLELPWAPPARVATAPVVVETEYMNGADPQETLLHVKSCAET